MMSVIGIVNRVKANCKYSNRMVYHFELKFSSIINIRRLFCIINYLFGIWCLRIIKITTLVNYCIMVFLSTCIFLIFSNFGCFLSSIYLTWTIHFQIWTVIGCERRRDSEAVGTSELYLRLSLPRNVLATNNSVMLWYFSWQFHTMEFLIAFCLDGIAPEAIN